MSQHQPGIYRFASRILYFTYSSDDSRWYSQQLYVGTKIRPYGALYKLAPSPLILLHADPLILGEFSVGVVVSDLYPELFI